MADREINCKPVAYAVKEELTERVRKLNPKPHLTIIQVGEPAIAEMAIKNELKAAKEVGITTKHEKLSKSTCEDQLLQVIEKHNDDKNVDGILVFLPIESKQKIDVEACLDRVDPLKVVDGLSSVNAGRLVWDSEKAFSIPTTPKGCLRLLKQKKIALKNKRVVVVGPTRSGGAQTENLWKWRMTCLPAAHLFLQEGSMVTMRSADHLSELPELCKSADILFVDANSPELIKGEWIEKKDVTIIDCGLHDKERKKVGDVDRTNITLGRITPVTGGIHLLTVAMLLENTVEQAELRCKLGLRGIVGTSRY